MWSAVAVLVRSVITMALGVLPWGLAGCSPPRATLLTVLPDAQDVGPDAEHYRLTPANTEVEAEISAGATFTLGFTDVEGTLDIDPRDPTRTRLTVTVAMTSATASIDRVAEIAMSHHFLDAEVHPTARFATRTVVRTDEGLVTLAELDLHGVTQGLRTPTRVELEPCALHLDVAFSFDRHAFEMQTEGTLETMVSDTVAVIIRVKVARPCAEDGSAARTSGNDHVR